MAGADTIEVEGVVVEVLPDKKTYRVELANGHRLVAFVPGRARLNLMRWKPGDKVKLEMSPFDLSKGRIVVETHAI